MLDLAEQIARAVDDAVAPVTADEARARAASRTHFRRTAVLANVIAVGLVLAAVVAALAALGVARHATSVVVREPPPPAKVTRPTAPIALGVAVGRLVIPKINVDWIFVQGASAVEEAKGPIHDPASPLPGDAGNAVIAGYRTTHGAPFFHLDELRPGDLIRVTTRGSGPFTYVVDGSFVVPASGGGNFPANVLARVRDRTNSLTLITNTPKFSNAQRLVVTASR